MVSTMENYGICIYTTPEKNRITVNCENNRVLFTKMVEALKSCGICGHYIKRCRVVKDLDQETLQPTGIEIFQVYCEFDSKEDFEEHEAKLRATGIDPMFGIAFRDRY